MTGYKILSILKEQYGSSFAESALRMVDKIRSLVAEHRGGRILFLSKRSMMIDIIGAVFGDTSFIAYRPDLRKITPSVTAAILLQQIVHRWRKNGNEKFYKFREPCKHEKYHPGDSWTEELGFSGKEFDSALRSIGFKLGKTKNEIERKDAFIVYYRDNEGLTWYSLNEELLSNSLLGKYQGVAQRGSTKVIDQRETTNPYTEITTEITTERGASAFASAPPLNEKPKTPRGWTNLRRSEQGKAPLKTPRTTKQEETFTALKFKDYYKEQGYQQHGMQFFKVESKQREGVVSKLIINAYKSIGDLKPLIDWWLEGAGEWADYEPEQCLSAKSIERFLNKDNMKNKSIRKQKFIDLSEGGDEE